MKRTVFLLVSACLLASVTFCSAQDPSKSDGMRPKYRKLMQRAFLDLSDGYGVTDSIIVNLLPETKEEYNYFISMSKHANDSLLKLTAGYHKYLALVDSKDATQDSRMYTKIMYMAEFAEGEFTGFYFTLTDKLVLLNKPMFCAFYKRENSPKLAKLQKYQQNCK